MTTTQLNHVSYGPNDIKLNAAGCTVAQVEEALWEVLNLGSDLLCYVNGILVRDRKYFVLDAGVTVMFWKPYGVKGSGRENDMIDLLRSIDSRLGEIGKRLESVEYFIVKPKLGEFLTKPDYAVKDIARFTRTHGVKKAAEYTVRLACSDGRIPEAFKNEAGHYRIPRQAVMRLLQDGIPPERR